MPGVLAAGFDKADEQQGQPAQLHVRADAVLTPVVDGPHVDGVLEVAVDAPDLVQLLVARHHVLGAEAGDEGTAEIELRAAQLAPERLGATLDARRTDRLLRALAERTGRTRRRVTRTFMFTDIVASTDLVRVIGDAAWAAVACAIAIQRRLVEARRDHPYVPSVRIGLHTTEAARHADEYAGYGVHVAARVADVAALEVLIAADMAELTGDAFPIGERRTVALKGVDASVAIAEVALR